MILSAKSFLTYVFSAVFISVVAVAAGPSTTANVPNPAGVAHVYPSAESIPGGARVKAKFHMLETGSKVSWSILAPVVEADGSKRFIELALVDDRHVHDATNYHVERSYDLNYAAVNAMLKQKAPNAKLEVGPGTPIFVYARWMNRDWLNIYNDQPVPGRVVGKIDPNKWNHQWGGIGREGLVVLPGSNGQPVEPAKGFTQGGTTTSLDVVNKVDFLTASRFKNSGISADYTTIGSRFENELKLHIDVADIPKVAQFFQKLEKDPALVEQTFGKGWVLKANRKYVGQPMIDDYLDNAKSEAAEKGMALRYRTGNHITSLNFKPNDGRYAGNGVYERVEYDFRNFPDGTKPNTYSNPTDFINSEERINPLQLIRTNIPGSTPSDFFQKSVKITDEREKYELTAPSGDQVEISVDHVKARRLDPNGKEYGNLAEFGQLEVEVNHIGAKGSNNAVNGGNTYLSEGLTANGKELDTYLAGLKVGATLMRDMEPVFHGEKDFKADSPIKTVNASNFKLAFDVFDKIRDGAFGPDWVPSGQKYAVAAAALGMLPPERFAPSVQKMVQDKLKNEKPTDSEKQACVNAMVKITQM